MILLRTPLHARFTVKNLCVCRNPRMQHVSNQLNKVKTIENARECTIQADAASSFISAILEDIENFNDKKMAVFNCTSGMLVVVTGLLCPQSLVAVLDKAPDTIFTTNIKKFKIANETVVGALAPFGDKCFDVSIVAPVLNKAKGVQLKDIKHAVKISKITYALHKMEFKDKLLDELPGAEMCGTVSLKLPGSSHYTKNENSMAQFNIIKIKNI